MTPINSQVTQLTVYCKHTLVKKTRAKNTVISRKVNIHLKTGCGVDLSKSDW